MKKLLYIFLFSLLCSSVMAQSSKGFSFQGFARGADGAALQNEPNLNVMFELYVDDNQVFKEEQILRTDEYGVFQAVIGSSNTEDFDNLDFANFDYKLQVSVKIANNYELIASKMLWAVPYAKAAEKAVEANNVRVGGNGVPAGCVMPFAGEVSKIPEGWLLCDGTEYNNTDYPNLATAIATAWGGSTTTFKVPDLRGAFLRGADHGRGWDDNAAERESVNGGNAGDIVGSYQGDLFRSHNHSGNTNESGWHSHRLGFSGDYSNEQGWPASGFLAVYATDRRSYYGGEWQAVEGGGNHTHELNINNTGGSETRPENMAVNYIIKY